MYRRTFLKLVPSVVAPAGLTGSLARMALGEDQASKSYSLPAKAKNCIVFFMEGGPSQFDLFSYKPKLRELDGERPPEDLLVGQRFAFIKKDTAVLKGSPRTFSQFGRSGMWFSDLLPNLARQADRLCMLNAVHTSQFNHHPAQLVAQTGGNLPGKPSLGAWLAYALGSESPDLPAHVALNSSAFVSAGESLWGSGFVPGVNAGVLLHGGDIPVLNLARPTNVSEADELRTIQLIQRLNGVSFAARFDEAVAQRSQMYELASAMQRALPEAVDLRAESTQTLERYGVNRSDLVANLDPNHRPLGGFSAFSRHCLLARRLVERGVRAVSIVTGTWDMHGNLDAEIPYFAGMIDQPIAALLEELHERGLLEETLVLFLSEFGRTPLGEGSSGRDHHPNAFNVWMAGGGVRGGLSYGETDELGWEGISGRVSYGDIHATVLRLLGIEHTKLVYGGLGGEQRLTPITESVRVIHEIVA